MRLVELLKSPETSLSAIADSVDALSRQLLGNLPPTPPPAKLFVFADGTAMRIPWSVLVWPGASAPLVESTAIELVRLGGDEKTSARENRQYVVSASSSGQGSGLEYLPAADTEAELVGGALSSSSSAPPSVVALKGRDATPKAVGMALTQPGAWVHIAAHGETKPERMGYSGLWLASEDNPSKPAFMSQFDVLEQGVAAHLVVLDACALGDNGGPERGDSSFAAALSLAGADQVVSALWNISDSAAAIWVPPFYSTLLADPDRNAATALRAAQMHLRASRHFAHPFFWAGMQATGHLTLQSTRH